MAWQQNKRMQPTRNKPRAADARAFGNHNHSTEYKEIGGAMRIDLKPVATLDEDERTALKVLTAAVYPPEVVAMSPGRYLQWTPPDYSLLVFTPEDELVSHVGIVVRTGTLNGVSRHARWGWQRENPSACPRPRLCVCGSAPRCDRPARRPPRRVLLAGLPGASPPLLRPSRVVAVHGSPHSRATPPVRRCSRSTARWC